MILLFTFLSFLSGSLMFSYWIGLQLQKDIQMVGDGNPGAANLWKAAGYKYGLIGVILDFSKGFVPVFFIIDSGYVMGYELIPIALAPIVGHAISPFLAFRGGKATAVTFGVWSALSYFALSFVLAILLAVGQVIARVILKGQTPSSNSDSIQMIIAMVILQLYLIITNDTSYVIWICFGNLLILLYTNRNVWF